MFKRVIFLFLLSCVLLTCVSGKIKEFNYYERDYFGSFEIEKLDIDNIEGFPLLKYEAIMDSGNKIKEIRGYYATGELKFIDSVDKGKIKQTKYFDIKGKEVLVKDFKRENNNLAIDLWYVIDHRSETPILISEFFILKKNHYIYSRIVKRKNKDGSNRVEKSEGSFNLKFEPLTIESKRYQETSPGNISGTDTRKYDYNEKGQKIQFTRLLNGKEIEIQKYYYNEDSKVVRKYFHNFYRDTEYEQRWEDNQWIYYKKSDNQFIRVEPHHEKFKSIKNIKVFYYLNEINKLTKEYEDRIHIYFDDESMIATKNDAKLISLDRKISLYPYLFDDSITVKELGYWDSYFSKGYY